MPMVQAPVVWYRCYDEQGNTYYFNSETEGTSWNEPSGAGVKVLEYSSAPQSLTDLIKQQRQKMRGEIAEQLVVRVRSVKILRVDNGFCCERGVRCRRPGPHPGGQRARQVR